jgi:soluble lytic murein transglycosylase
MNKQTSNRASALVRLSRVSRRVGAMSLITASLCLPSAHAGDKAARDLASEKREIRLTHAHELLGKYYPLSVVPQIDDLVYEWTKDSLKGKWHKQARGISQTIIKESLRRGFDPLFLMAMIQSESSFNPAAHGPFGEIGLMQLRPATARWIAGKYKISWKGAATLRDPRANIRIGAAFLDYLRDRFDSQAQLYVAAYNMGYGNVKEALSREVWPKDYPRRVMRHYIELYRQVRTEVAKQDVATREAEAD